MAIDYLRDPYVGRRRLTREVCVGDVGIGGDNPIRVQSMTTTDTRDTKATADQIERLAHAGCEIVRLTVPSIRDAEVLGEIQADLTRRRVDVPLVADIHFTPNAAMIAANFVSKVRVNPGNYVDKKKFEVREFSDVDYESEIERVSDRFRPLVERCKQNGVAMRIGTNHGSLSDRIMNRYGDTPLGMVESALEFLAVCEAENFHDVVFSMKASNTHVAIQAYRLLAQHLNARLRDDEDDRRYPFHLGVTEAGDAADGRIKSAIGIGALLEDGLGDTIRVSLTEDPVHEVPVARALARRAEARWVSDEGRSSPEIAADFTRDPYSYARRVTREFSLGGNAVGDHAPVAVELNLGRVPDEDIAEWARFVGAALAGVRDVACESIQLFLAEPGELARVAELRSALVAGGLDMPLAVALPLSGSKWIAPVELAQSVSRLVLLACSDASESDLVVAAKLAAQAGVAVEWCLGGDQPETIPGCLDAIGKACEAAGLRDCLFSLDTRRAVHVTRLLASCLRERGWGSAPIVLRYEEEGDETSEESLLAAAIELGAPLCDGVGDMVSLAGYRDPARALDLAYRILQAARMRFTRTEYISCPSCGRTLFDLEQVTARIKQKTQHLSGVKIAVMGCIVNGPGEMADADFGYVGSGPGSVTLYVGKEIRVRNVPEEEAPRRLVELIQESGYWKEP